MIPTLPRLKSRTPTGEEELFKALGVEPIAPLKNLRLERKNSFTIGRKEIRNLEKWLDRSLKQAYKDSADCPEELILTVTSIYSLAFEELLKQVSSNCKERGTLLSKVWRAHQELLKKYIRIQNAREELQKENFKKGTEVLTKEHQESLKKQQKVNQDLQTVVQELKNKLAYAKESLEVKKLREERLVDQLHVVQQHYRAIKREILILKEDNRILSTKLESCAYEVQHKVNGYLVPIPRADLRIYQKSSEDLESILAKDPVLQDLSDTPEDLAERIEEYEKFENIEMNRANFTDSWTEPWHALYTENATMTDVTELAGDCVGVKQKIRKRDYRNEFILRRQMTITQMMEIDVGSDSENEEDFKDTQKEKVKKHKQLKMLLSGLKDEAQSMLRYDNMPHLHVLHLLVKNANLVLSFIENHPLEKKELSEDEYQEGENEQNLLISHVKSKIYQKNKHSKVVERTIQHFSNMPVDRIRHVSTKKSLLSLITQVYRSPEITQPFAEYVFSFMSKQVKNPKNTRSRFEQIVAGTVKYKYITRIRLFGRFLGVYSGLSEPDFKLFMKSLNILQGSSSGKNVQHLENSEHMVFPAVRCKELLSNYHKYFTELDLREITHKLSILTHSDKVQEVVNADDFLELFIEKYSYRRHKAIGFLRYVFDASDLNNDGYLDFQEFKMLVTHISELSLSAGALQDLFNAHSETFLSDDDSKLKAISLENLGVLNSQYKIFSVEKIAEFSQARNDTEGLEHLENIENLEFVIKEIYWRFSRTKKWELHLVEVINLLEILKIRLTEKKNPLSDWIALRLLQEESKRCVISDRVQQLLPIACKISSLED